ncbi:MAG: electron transfer flavoprotein subunit beta/FixA family protein [Peptococcaceae bacterium]|nr:electron transfer flavoprotein subunit beta/FixA family protein [Peptococcaceae bacterium]
MNIVVWLRQTFDTEAKIVLDSEGKIDPSGVSLIINPYDEFAIEEGIKLKEQFGGEVTVVALGGSHVSEALRCALAMGADKAVALQESALEGSDEFVTANVLAEVIKTLPYDIILTGRVAIDEQSSQVAIRLAEILGVDSVSSVLSLEINENVAIVTHDIDGGYEVIEVTLPAVLTAQKGLNEPRYPSVAGIMKAKKKELKILSLADLGISPAAIGQTGAKMKLASFSLPPQRQAGRRIFGEPEQTAAELVQVLLAEAKVI